MATFGLSLATSTALSHTSIVRNRHNSSHRLGIPLPWVSKEEPFKGTPFFPLLFDLMIEPLIRGLRASNKGYDIAACGLQLANKWYADDRTLVTNSIEDMIVLLILVDQFSKWPGIHINANKYKITAFIHALKEIPRKRTETTH